MGQTSIPHRRYSSEGGANSARLVFISACEPSADQHGAALIEATRRLDPAVRFVGVAGPKMRAAGCDVIFDMTSHSAMLLKAARVARQAITMRVMVDKHLRRYPFATAVFIDSPTLHLPLAARAHGIGIPVLYYIAPQLWAWGAHRIHKLRNNVDCLAVILPFEEQYFRDQGVDAVFVGHPLAESFRESCVQSTAVPGVTGRGNPAIALLPGSRRHVVEEVLPGQLAVAERIAQVFPNSFFGVSVANPQVAPIVAHLVKRCPLKVESHHGPLHELIQAADLVLVASGTTTLQVAFHAKPMIVMYNSSRFFYHLVARWMIRTPYYSLPNILAGRRIVPEFMPYYTSTRPIADCAIRLLGSEDSRKEMATDLEAVTAPLRSNNAAQTTAGLLLSMLQHS